MNLFLNTLRAPRVIPFVGSFIFVIAIVIFLNLPVQTQGQGVQVSYTQLAAKRSFEPAAEKAADVFLRLAQKAGQSVPAKRLLDFKAKTDPKGQERYWVVVDFNQSSTKKRFYLFDTQQNTVETFYVSHGKGSEGAADDGIAEVFSNEPSSNSSSLGIYRTMDEYNGNHGRSMRLQGLEAGNSNALDRAVVLHRADYVSENIIKTTGRLGRSQGCFAVEPAVADMLIDKLKGGAYIIAWKS